MNREDFEGKPCSCGECVQAQVSGKPIRRDPRTGAWLHGYKLRRVIEAEERFWKEFRDKFGKKVMR